MSGRTVEVSQFHLGEDTDEKTFLEASDAMQSGFLSHADGFIDRELVRGEYDLWMDIIHWSTLSEAKQAAAEAMNHPTCLRFFTMIDETSMTTMYLEQMRDYR